MAQYKWIWVGLMPLFLLVSSCTPDGAGGWVLGTWSEPMLDSSPTDIGTQAERSWHLAWGDYYMDGDLDVAVANGSWTGDEANRLYENDGGVLTSVWTTPEVESSYSVAWGDWDDDGDLDLAVGGGYGVPSRVYENDGGALTLAWTSDETFQLAHAVWADWNGDGLLDLATGSINEPIRVY